MDSRILILLAIFGIAFLLMNVQVSQNKEISCNGFDDCMSIAEKYGMDKASIVCETQESVEICKVIIEGSGKM